MVSDETWITNSLSFCPKALLTVSCHQGITVGITSSQVPVYLAEIARKEKRGSLIIIQQLAIEVGILVMYFLGKARVACRITR